MCTSSRRPSVRGPPTCSRRYARASRRTVGTESAALARPNGALAELSKTELGKRARKAGIKGRSTMTKDELVAVLEAR